MKLLYLTVLLAVAASASPTVRHRWQLNANRLGIDIERGQGRIVGGVATDITEVPYQVVLHYRRSFTCGGSIITLNRALSAAHCTSGRDHSDFQVLVGQTNRFQGDLKDVSTVIEHEEYDDWELWNDVVILTFATNFVEGPTVRRTLLPGITHLIPGGLTLRVSGFGDLASGSGQFPDILQSVEVPAWTNQQCQEIYPNEEIKEQHLCAGAVGRDACQGDSGGPLSENFGTAQAMVVGVVSWGYGCAAQWPTVYARVSYFLPWILAHS